MCLESPRMRSPLAILKSAVEARKGIEARLAAIEAKIDAMAHFSQGSRGTYLGDKRVLVKCVVAGRQIAFIVEADDRLIAPWFIATGNYETELTDFFVKTLKPNSHCIDVGANFGYFTCLMARFCPEGKVIGVEPDLKIFEIARDNTFINGFSGIAEVVNAAASDGAGELTLHRRMTRSGNTSIARVPEEFTAMLGEQPSQAFNVKSVRVDDLLPKLSGRVDIMKVDVEGAEPLVFRGARETIASNPDLTIVMEWSPGQIVQAGFDVEAFLADLTAMHLAAFDMGPQGLRRISTAELLKLPYRAGIVLKR